MVVFAVVRGELGAVFAAEEVAGVRGDLPRGGGGREEGEEES